MEDLPPGAQRVEQVQRLGLPHLQCTQHAVCCLDKAVGQQVYLWQNAVAELRLYEGLMEPRLALRGAQFERSFEDLVNIQLEQLLPRLPDGGGRGILVQSRQ